MNSKDRSINRIEALTVSAGKEEYAVGIHTVREIRGYSNVTAPARSAGFVKGMIELQGSAVPVVDIRILLGFAQPASGDVVVVVVLTIAGNTVGVVVDGISDVVSLSPEQIRPAQDLGRNVRAEHVMGSCAVGRRTITLVDMDRMLADAGLHCA
ncbi:chemotaxis protein CheW [Noviherbaspirillum sp. ST9]|uniref:chemotaxis protein CheW n=1 Tax=Noviherbaspirillum sp. ST9 TaxID=3401606 RepID=UPI003B58A421